MPRRRGADTTPDASGPASSESADAPRRSRRIAEARTAKSRDDDDAAPPAPKRVAMTAPGSKPVPVAAERPAEPRRRGVRKAVKPRAPKRDREEPDSDDPDAPLRERVAMLSLADTRKQLAACAMLHNQAFECQASLFSRGMDPATSGCVAAIIGAGAVPLLVKLLSASADGVSLSSSMVLAELANRADHARLIMDAGAITATLPLLELASRERVGSLTRLLRNLSVRLPAARDAIDEAGVLSRLMTLAELHGTTPEFLQLATSLVGCERSSEEMSQEPFLQLVFRSYERKRYFQHKRAFVDLVNELVLNERVASKVLVTLAINAESELISVSSLCELLRHVPSFAVAQDAVDPLIDRLRDSVALCSGGLLLVMMNSETILNKVVDKMGTLLDILASVGASDMPVGEGALKVVCKCLMFHPAAFDAFIALDGPSIVVPFLSRSLRLASTAVKILCSLSYNPVGRRAIVSAGAEKPLARLMRYGSYSYLNGFGDDEDQEDDYDDGAFVDFGNFGDFEGRRVLDLISDLVEDEELEHHFEETAIVAEEWLMDPTQYLGARLRETLELVFPCLMARVSCFLTLNDWQQHARRMQRRWPLVQWRRSLVITGKSG
jgi:hypothetical protein